MNGLSLTTQNFAPLFQNHSTFLPLCPVMPQDRSFLFENAQSKFNLNGLPLPNLNGTCAPRQIPKTRKIEKVVPTDDRLKVIGAVFCFLVLSYFAL